MFTVFFSFYLGQNLPYWLGVVVVKLQRRKIVKKLRPTSVVESRLCPSIHNWTPAPHTLDEKGEFTYVNVCKDCGFIPVLNLMATPDGLEYIERNKQYMANEEKMKEDFIRQEEEGIKKHFTEELKNGLDFEKLTQVYFAGQTLKERLILYRLTKMQDRTESNDER
jgi:hypothetical protein